MSDKPITTEAMLSCIELSREENPCDCCAEKNDEEATWK